MCHEDTFEEKEITAPWHPASEPPHNNRDVLVWRTSDSLPVVGWFQDFKSIDSEKEYWAVYQVGEDGLTGSICGAVEVTDVLKWMDIPA